jgi:hypothetical protein
VSVPRSSCLRSGAALCRLSAAFAHPNAYPNMNYGAICVVPVMVQLIVLITLLIPVKRLVPVSGVNLPPER